MGPLKLAAAALLLAAAQPVAADQVTSWRPYSNAASARFGVPLAWIERVMWQESGGRTMRDGKPIRSRAGAMGLMQLMPATWTCMRVWLRLGNDPDDPRDNIAAGTAYLRLMYDRFGYPGLFAAYNAGPARYAAYLASGSPLPAETRAYLATTAGPMAIATPGLNGRDRPALLVRLAFLPRPSKAASTTSASPLFAIPQR